jgi:hypothetical protein
MFVPDPAAEVAVIRQLSHFAANASAPLEGVRHILEALSQLLGVSILRLEAEPVAGAMEPGILRLKLTASGMDFGAMEISVGEDAEYSVAFLSTVAQQIALECPQVLRQRRS